MSLKFNCSNSKCRQRVEVDDSLAGADLKCPACGSELHAPVSHDIRFTCSNGDCRQHIVVDISEAGRFLKCPGCAKALKVPGDPPKTIFPGPHKTTRQAIEIEPIASNVAQWERFSGLKRLTCGWVAGLLLFVAICIGFRIRMSAITPPHLDEMAEEIYTHGSVNGVPVEDRLGLSVYYLQDKDGGLNVFRLNKKFLKRELMERFEIVNGQSDYEWHGFSPDRRLYAYSHVRDRENMDMILCDAESGKIRDRFDIGACGKSESVWVSTNQIVMLNGRQTLYLLNLQTSTSLGTNGGKGLVKLRTLEGEQRRWMKTDSDHSVAYVQKSNIWSLDIRSNQEFQQTRFNQGVPRELVYDPRSELYLFMLQESEQKKERTCFAYGPRSARTPQLRLMTNEICALPVWLQDGRGMAYTVTAGSNVFVAIRPDDQTLWTNLFIGKTVQNYSASADGNRLWMVARDEKEMSRIWEYDIHTKALRALIPEQELQVYRQVLPAITAVVTNNSGKRVDYYYVQPAKMQSGRKYPAILDQYSANRYDQDVQFVANSGIFYISANRFGVSRWRDVPEFEDALAVHQKLLKNPNIDPGRIYVSGLSFSTVSATRLIDERPDLWRGGIFISPVHLPRFDAKVARFPSIFVSIGDSDILNDQDFRQLPDKLHQETCRNLAPMQIDIRHAGHTFNNDVLKEAYLKIVKFILLDY